MSAEQRAGDFPDVERLVITDEDGDRFLVDRYPRGGVIVAALSADEDDEVRAIPVRITPDDREALVAFLTWVPSGRKPGDPCACDGGAHREGERDLCALTGGAS